MTDRETIDFLKDTLRRILDRSMNDMGKRSKILDIRKIAIQALTDVELDEMANALSLELENI